ncbi:MAG: helical backbone metal receptor [bacterium]
MVGQVFAASPQRIISAMPSITEILYALELDEKIVGVTTNCNYPPRAKKKQKVGGFFLNLEKVVSLDPDLIIMQADAQPKDIKRFREYGLPVYTVNPLTIEELMVVIREIGEKTGTQGKAQQITKDMQSRLRGVERRYKSFKPSLADVLKLWQAKEKKRQALVIVGLNPLIVAGGGTFIDDVIKKAGVENVAGKARAAYPQFSFERLVKEDPQYIIMPKGLIAKEAMRKDKRWRSLEAVRQDRILFVDQDIISRPGPRVVEAVEAIAEFIYQK